ncbi:tripartite-type tricarboxylate transporter receptor subunit TctC [Rhodoferax ferrireducens]|uniref:Tripartite-type tricarboxylate transporter receptor subunit TctC n=1 Tax=Rhodoferax ferrireducens TaxID=192843 RepID=A0ABU2C510_9BURK|nr:tripartite tricarboxylate transporter substrate binding protein [Rhodoferax ferrireducens]MDR7376420.1 tripartite-type tricarboxylate transporter receptor subunit TctC [Rhodoferax ferrireducens]
MHIPRRYALLSAALLALPALAQDYPSKTITLVVPFTAGGGVDAIARLLADKLRASLGQSVVVDNKPGASGMLGANAVAKAKGDGYTLLIGSAGETAINPLVYKGRMQYAPEKDLAPITLVTRVPNVLAASPNLPVKNLEELVAYAKKNPGKLSYATSGVGNPQHLNGELLQSLAGIKMNHVPYKGSSGQMVDVASGNVDITFVSMAGAAPFIKGNRVKVLAVTSAKRASFAPDLPAIAEYAPLASYNLENWFGLFAPASTPAAVQAKLNAAVTEALRDPELVKRLQDQGGEPAPMAQAQFKDFIATETAKYARIVDAAHITAE